MLIRSFAHAFLLAGGSAVVGSLWDVDDEASRFFSVAFHNRLRDGDTPATALRRAQLDVLVKRGRKAFSEWAAFQIYS